MSCRTLSHVYRRWRRDSDTSYAKDVSTVQDRPNCVFHEFSGIQRSFVHPEDEAARARAVGFSLSDEEISQQG